ncbi:hypothetical protein [Mangrovibacterium marinum]|uniref:hypothetical protein n=1 Tax=Mangrovibacterium marinum TaxID=1639118 RepID=UPI002A18CD79|nr:hypothetical protein [Mangrovibacterium marinum]
MEAIIIQPKDQDDLKFFVEMAKRLGAKFKTLDELQDEQLLSRMLQNAETNEIAKSDVIATLKSMANEDPSPYNED